MAVLMMTQKPGCSLNESPRPKAGKSQRQSGQGAAEQKASMKVPARRRGNSHPKLTRNYAAETGALREPRGRPTQKVYPSSHSGIQTLLTSQNITRATRQDYVTCQVLAETHKASKGHYPHLYYQSAIELVIPSLPCLASLANEQHAARE